MLNELSIRDFAIIDQLTLEFAPGFVVFTGETGAGKSIIIDAVEMLLGARAQADFVRSGAERAIIEGVFRIGDTNRDRLIRLLEAEDLFDDPDYLTLGREIRANGRSVCRVNGRTTTALLLRQIGEQLVDVHGQSEHLSLLRVREHLTLLDRYADSEDLLRSYLTVFQSLTEVQRELADLRVKETHANERLDLLNYQVQEIETARLIPGEDAELQEERTRLANAEQLAHLAEQVIRALDESADDQLTATDAMGSAVEALDGLSRIDSSVQSVFQDTQGLADQIVDVVRQIRIYRDGIEYNVRRLDEVEERLNLIQTLKRKYGASIEAIIAFGVQALDEKNAFEHAGERLLELGRVQQELLEQLGAVGQQLSSRRKKAGEVLAREIEQELHDLNMEGARFGVGQTWRDDPDGVPVGARRVTGDVTGLDQVEFLIAPNPGEGLNPMVKIASGGETSRLMLGLKSVLAHADQTPTLIFDEIDQGIGGRVGIVVGQKLWGLTSNHQVLCITHLPQLAAFGDQHIKIEKRVVDGRTVTQAREMAAEERKEELALMMGGVSNPNLESARDLLRQAQVYKANSG